MGPNGGQKCYPHKCTVNSDSTYKLEVTVGNKTVVCATKDQSHENVDGNPGFMVCPDP